MTSRLPRFPLLSALALVATASACSALLRGDPGEGERLPPVTEATPTPAELRAAVPEEFVPALELIARAIEDREDRVARAALDRLLGREPTGRTLELARAMERILDGRAVAGRLSLALVAEEQEEICGRYTLCLSARLEGEGEPGGEVVLRAGGARLREALLMVDPEGNEQRAERQQGLPFPEELLLPVDEDVRLPLAEVQLPTAGGMLALSSRLDLELVPGEFVDDQGRYLPAQRLPVEAVELVRLASFLPTGSIEPEELVSYVSAGKLYVPALMERAVRILPADRERTLDLLEPLVESMALVDLELLVPALRWLTRRVDPAGNPEAWRAFLRARGARQDERAPASRGLDLPDR